MSLIERVLNPDGIEIIAEELNWFGNSHPCIDWHRKEKSSEDIAIQKARREQANEIINRLKQELPHER